MSPSARRQYVAPRQAEAEPVCLLTKEWANRRAEPPDRFLALATGETVETAGSLYRLPARPGMWERVETFVAEEGECCPFFAFEQWEEDGEIVLRIFQPGARS